MKKASGYCMVFLLFIAGSMAFSQNDGSHLQLARSQYDSLSAGDKELVATLLKSQILPLHDTARLNLLVKLSENCDEQDILIFANPAQKLADDLLKREEVQKNSALKVRILNKKALALNNIGFLYWQKGNVAGGLGFFKLSLQIRKETGDKAGMAESFNNIGEIYRLQGNIPEGLEYLNNSLKVREGIHDTAGTIISLNNLALIYLQQDAFEKAMEYYKLGLVLAEAQNDKLAMGYIMHNIAYVFQTKKDTVSLMEYQTKALALFKEVNYPQGLSIVLNNMGAMHMNKKEYDKALECFTQAKDIMKNMVDVSGLSLTLINLGNLHFNRNEFDKAQEYGLDAMKTSRETGYPENIQRAALLLFNCYKENKEYAKALEMHELHVQMRDSIFNEANRKSTYKQHMKYEYEKQMALNDVENQKAVAIAEEAKKRQQFVSFAVGAGLLMASLFALFIFNRLQVARKQKLIIEEQKQIVEVKNKHITDSINYAKRIQDSILPSKEELSAYFPEHFLFFRPRDIVSGDFYWHAALPQSGKAILAIADCTGHGVPGAFMSMIGNTLLNEIVNEQKIIQPAEILDHLNEGIVKALHQESRTQDDGMDISVCLFDKEANKITFAGANHSMYMAGEKGIQEIKGDIYSIGSVFGKKNASFSQKEISVEKGATLFFFSDGFPDQVGGPKGKKFLVSRMEKLFQDISTFPISEQEQTVLKTFNDWKNDHTQLDDVLLAGIKL